MKKLKVRYLVTKQEDNIKIISNTTIELEKILINKDIEKYIDKVTTDLVALPLFINGHIHILDKWLDKFFHTMYIDDVVGAPFGIKYFYLNIAAESTLLESIEYALTTAANNGTGKVLTVVELGLRNYKLVNKISEKIKIPQVEQYLEPSVFHVTQNEETSEKIISEIENIAKLGMNIELISPLNYTREELEFTKEIKRRYNLKVMTHVSETYDTHEEGDLEQAIELLDADILVHCTFISESEVEYLIGRDVVINPKSNLKLVGKLPPIEHFVKNDINVFIGTDNVGLNDPNIWDELKVLYEHVNPEIVRRVFSNNLLENLQRIQVVSVKNIESLDSSNLTSFIKNLCKNVVNVIGVVEISDF